jgi:hypothetical protein
MARARRLEEAPVASIADVVTPASEKVRKKNDGRKSARFTPGDETFLKTLPLTT